MPNQNYMQYGDDSCGAACLMVAATELGIATLPRAVTGLPFPLLMRCDRPTESLIYRVTCVNGARRQGGSWPDGIARAAISMGLSVTVHMYGCVIPKLLRWWYPTVLKELARIHVPVKYGSPPKLTSNERMIVLVAVGVTSSHYVLYRPDGTYMDPDSGTNHVGTLWGMGQSFLKRYVDTGIYLTVRNEQSLHGTSKFFFEV